MPLNDEELAEARAAEQAEAKQARVSGDPVVGDLVIRRRARDWIWVWVLSLLAPIVWQLGQPIVGGGIAAGVVIAFFVHRARRVARLKIGADGSLVLPGHAEIDWSTLTGLLLEYRYPWGAAAHEKAHDETLHVVFEQGDGTSIRLAQGALWRVRPTRARVGCRALDRWLKARARAAGMSIEGLPAKRGKGWIARRRAPAPGV